MKRLLLHLVFLCAVLATVVCPATVWAEGDATLQRDGAAWVGEGFRVLNLESRGELAIHLVTVLDEAHDRVEAQTGIRLQGEILVVWAREDDFMEFTGFRPENVAAAASASRSTIWINEVAWRRSTIAEQRATLAHEFGHLVLGALPGGKQLPLWANEGIVMHLAGQADWDDHFRLLAAHALGGAPRLADLETTFPRSHGPQGLAYRMGYVAVQVVSEHYGGEPGSVARLVQLLADPVRGPMIAQDLHDPSLRDAFDAATRRALGSRVTIGLVLMTGTGTIFILATVLMIVAYLNVRRRRAERDRREQDEREPWEESLTEEDIQDIYGDREDRWK